MPTTVVANYTDGTGSDAVQSFFNTVLLVRGVFEHHAQGLAKMKTFAQRQGSTMIWRRQEALPLATTPLVEAVTPSNTAKSKTDVAATLAGYGAYVENSDFLGMTTPEGLMEDAELLAQQLGETFDKLYHNLYATATNTTFSNGTATAAVNTVMVYDDWLRIGTALRNRKAKRFTPTIHASQKVGTLPVQEAYWVLLSESQLFDVIAAATIGGADKLILAAEYGSTSAIRGEYGALKNGMRLLPVPDANAFVAPDAGGLKGTTQSTTGVNSDVHSAFILGREAALGVNLAVGNGGMIRHGVGSAGSADALDQRSTMGWKKYDARAIGNQAFLQEYQCAVTA